MAKQFGYQSLKNRSDMMEIIRLPYSVHSHKDCKELLDLIRMMGYRSVKLYPEDEKDDNRIRQRKALRKVWDDTFALQVDDVFLDVIIDTVEGA